MRILALDHGTKRTGIAISDELGIIAQPLEFIPTEPRDAFFRRLAVLISERNVTEIVVGMPYNMDGSIGPSAERVQRFVVDLREKVSRPVHVCDERLTTSEAEGLLIRAGTRRAKRKQVVDKMAAAFLLQDFLDARSSKSGDEPGV